MNNRKLLLKLSVCAVVILSGCAAPPITNSTVEGSYCYKTSRGRVIACTQAAAPSLTVDAEAKRFTPDPMALTVYVVRRNDTDGRHVVKVQSDNSPSIETLPNTMVRMKLNPGRHTITLEFEGRSQNTTVEGKAGEVRFVRIDGTVFAWKNTYKWVAEPETAIRERALKTRLVADVTVR